MSENDKTQMRLEGEATIVIERTFRAPARIVFDAWTKPEFVRRWWAPASRGAELSECTADVRVAGTYRYVTRAHGGEFAFSGVYTEVTRHTRLVYTQTFEPMASSGQAVITVLFEETAGLTRLVATEAYPSAAVRDVVLQSGMEDGMRETMNQLDDLVRSLTSTAGAATAAL